MGKVERSSRSWGTNDKRKFQMSKKIKKEAARLYIEYDQFENGGDSIDPNDRWSNRTDRVIEVNFIKLHRQQPAHRFFYDSIEINKDLAKIDKLYLCVVRYSTGDTFGRTTGEWYIVGVAPNYQIASLMLQEAIIPSKEGDYRNYKPWEGYFERLETTEIYELSVV